jgi:hypothetical protein
MRNVSAKGCTENQNTYFMFIKFFRKSCRMRDNVEKYGGIIETANSNTAVRCTLD